MSRAAQIDAFLAAHGWGSAERVPLAGDASFRRYERVRHGRRHAILMDAPPEREDVRPFLAIDRLLRRWGYSAPRVLAVDVAAGLLLLEDLGEDGFTSRLARDPASAPVLYEAAVALLVDLHRRLPPARIPPYDMTALLGEARLFAEWYLPARDPAVDPAPLCAALEERFRPLLRDLATATEVLVLRDYHADNLLWMSRRRGLRRVGLLDFQDARRGHPAYDLVSLLQDARRDVPESLEEEMIAFYCERAQPRDRAAFRRAYHLLGAQRATKVIGIFTRLHRRDGKPRYLALLPRVWDHLERNLAAARLDGLRAWFDEVAPPACRRRELP
ncbi:MAG: aminoglycoside phosphotransferase [Alphaproteobacteria bacterium]|nr:MAG: aminoglycoside phosphotransferase [Alphaproteobacteria bacterium]